MIRSFGARGAATVAVGMVTLYFLWRAVVTGLVEGDLPALANDPSRATDVLRWDGGYAPALRQRAAAPSLTPAQSLELWRRAIVADPTDWLAPFVVATRLLDEGQRERGQQILSRLVVLSPGDVRLRLQLGDFYLREKQPQDALPQFSAALTLRPVLGQKVYERLLAIMVTYPDLAGIDALIREGPPWWSSFFQYAAQVTPQLAVVRRLYLRRRELAGGAMTRPEHFAMIARLKRERQWEEAYLTWLNALPTAQWRFAGGLYNGGFELPLSRGGFGWQVLPLRNTAVNTQRTYGMTGTQALHVVFRHPLKRFHHLYQPLLLAPGLYHLRGKVRVDNLQTNQGVRWEIHCADSPYRRLAASAAFRGSAKWQYFAVVFTVPGNDPTCVSQRLQLVVAGQTKDDFRVRGDLWFDDMQIKRVVSG